MQTFKKLFGTLLVATVIALTLQAVTSKPVYAATCSWTGDVDSNWSESGNWTGCSGAGVPVDGDTIDMSTVSTHPFTNNDLTGLDLESITVTGVNHSISGNPITIHNSISLADAAAIQIYTNVTLTHDAVYSVGTDSAFLRIEGNTDLNGHQLNLDSSSSIYVNGNITGTGTLVSSGNSIAALFGDNTFTGTIYLEAGSYLYFNSSTAAGDAANVITSTGDNVTFGSTNYNITIPNDINLSGSATLFNNGESNVYSGDINLGGVLTVNSQYDPFASNSLTLSGSITGTGSLVTQGDAPLTISGTTSNTFSGLFTVTAGNVYLAKTGSAHAMGGNFTVGDGTGSAQTANVSAAQPGQVNSHVTTINSDGWLDFNGTNDTISNVTGTGKLTVESGTQLVIVTGDVTFGGTITGAGQLLKAGTGTFILTHDSPFTGYLSAAEGTTLVNAAFNGMTVTTNGGAIGGTGTVKVISGTNGIVSPGATVNGIGTLHTSQTFTINSLDTLSIHTSGPYASQTDKVVATGNIAINDATLSVTPDYTVLPGATWVILESTGGTVTGQFAGLADGATLTIGGKAFKIFYLTNKVTLVSEVTLYLTSFKVSKTNAIPGTPITITVQWSSSGTMPTGHTTFKDGDRELGQVTMVAGKASLTVSNFSLGTHSLSAIYSGDELFGGAISGPRATVKIANAVVDDTTPEVTPTVSITPTVIFSSTDVTTTPTATPTKAPEKSNSDINPFLLFGAAVVTGLIAIFFVLKIKPSAKK